MRALVAAIALAGALAPLPSATAQTPPAAAQEGMVGPGIYVSDPERSLRFYIEALGMRVRMRFGPPDRPDIVIGFGSDPTAAGIMLLSDRAGPVRRPIRHVHGFDRIALRLPDLAAVNARLRTLGFAPGEIRTVHGGISMMMLSDPDGYRIELIDSKPAPKGN